jgi:D-alanyl-D-alanine carboxypeptidase
LKIAAGVVFVASLVAASDLQAQSIDVAAIDKLASQAVEQRSLVGLSVGVMVNGRVVLAKGYGVSSLEAATPVTPDTLFAIGSVTKQFTCVTALLLEQDGKIRMSDPVSKYAPELTRGGEIRLIDLGQHVSGYRDYFPLDFVDSRLQKPRDGMSIAREYAGGQLDFEPGTRYSYSNTGYLVLGGIIEQVEGAPFGRVLQRRIFSPLGMRNTRIEPRPGDGALATGYSSFALARPIPAAREADGWLGAASGIWSTPTDILAWDLALMDGKLLSEASMRSLSAPRQLANGLSTGYGCGIVSRERDGMRFLTHGGGVGGFTARNSLIPGTRSAVVVMTNVENSRAAVGDLHGAILAKLIPIAADPPKVAGRSALADAVAMMSQFQAGAVDRTRLAAEFNAYLTPERVKAAAAALAPLGQVKSVQTLSIEERGWLEHSTIEFKFAGAAVEAEMYRSPSGQIEQFWPFRK